MWGRGVPMWGHGVIYGATGRSVGPWCFYVALRLLWGPGVIYGAME